MSDDKRSEAVEDAATSLWLTVEANGSYTIPLLDLYDAAVTHERKREDGTLAAIKDRLEEAYEAALEGKHVADDLDEILAILNGEADDD